MFSWVRNLMVFIAVSMICFSFVACGTAATATIARFADTSSNFIEIYSEGEVRQVGFSTNIVALKDFSTVGIIFVESSATIDSEGNIIEGSKITFDMLMREVQKLGGDDFINLRVDEIHNISMTEETRMVPTRERRGESWVTVDREQTVQIINRTVIYKANALAIKLLPGALRLE